MIAGTKLNKFVSCFLLLDSKSCVYQNHIKLNDAMKKSNENLPLFVPYALLYEANESLLEDTFLERDRYLGDGDLDVDRTLSDMRDPRLEDLRVVDCFSGLSSSKSSS